MEQIKITYLGGNGYVAVTPTTIMVFDYTTDPTQSLSRVLTEHPGLPVTFFVSGPGQNISPDGIFSMAETRQRTFVVSTTVDRAAISADMPVSWINSGDIMPGLPGDVEASSSSDGTDNVTFDITLPDESIMTFDGHRGLLSVGATTVTPEHPGEIIVL